MSVISTSLSVSPPPFGEERAALPLAASDVDLWRATLDGHPDDTMKWLTSLLSAEETARARRFFFERDRQRFVVARGGLRTILGRYLRCSPQAVTIGYGAHGKPRLMSLYGEEPLYFNVAHSDSLALFAITKLGEVGVDVERIREVPDWEQIAAVSFSPRELARLRACPESQRRDAFFAAWTRQEAVLKALGTGLGAVSPDSGDGRSAGDSPEAAFAVYPLRVAPGFAAALATRSEGQWSTCHTWPAPSHFSPSQPGSNQRVRLQDLAATDDFFL